jgi:hypothetical protein
MIKRIVNRIPIGRIIDWWIACIDRWGIIIHRRIIDWFIINGSIVVTEVELETRFKIPGVIRIKIKMTWVIISIYINMTIDHHVIFINFLLRWFTLVTINFLDRLNLCGPKLGITTCHSDEQCEENGAFE